MALAEGAEVDDVEALLALKRVYLSFTIIYNVFRAKLRKLLGEGLKKFADQP